MNGAPWGGSEELWYKAALFLAGSGKKVACAVYSWPQKEDRLKRLEKAGCTVYRLPNKKTSGGNFFKKTRQKQKAKALLPGVIASLPFEAYELTVVNQGGLEVINKPWQQLYLRLPAFVLLFHNYNEQDQFSASEKTILGKWTEAARQNLFAAGKAKEVLQKQMEKTINGAAVFVNPISFAPPSAPAQYPPLQNGHYVLSVFAALDVERKAQDKLIACLSSAAWKERPWLVNLYGEGKDRQLLENMIERYGLQGKVFLKGHTSDVAAAMKASHLILQLTRVDAMPLSVVEAMAMARPLVVSDVGDMAQWVEEGENGWVTPFEEQSINRRLQTAWDKREDWKEMGLHSFAIFQQRYPNSAEENFLQLLL